VSQARVSNAILLFVKFPQPGKVKTRLAESVGAEQAAAIYRTLVATVLRRLPRSERLIVAFEPPGRAAEVADWIAPLCAERAVEFIGQTDGDLGVRLAAAFAHAFSSGYSRVAAIGSDCVEISAADLAETWAGLELHDCVLGPAADGGYYLIALKKPEPSLFSGIPWSTPTVLSETLARLRTAGFSSHHLRLLQDVDTVADWHRVRAQLAPAPWPRK